MISSKSRPYSIARVYADVNENKPTEYWDYENHKIQWGLIKNYEIVSKIGRGKYSEVFQGVNVLKENISGSQNITKFNWRTKYYWIIGCC